MSSDINTLPQLIELQEATQVVPAHAGKTAISVENLCKCYQIYEKPRDRLLQMLARGRRQYFREFWALNDISFEVEKGETVGIVGRNGSGKSTLLQLICGTLNPTRGGIQTSGRIAALLELGSGFNPEFTGRENVYMNAAVLGLSRDEVDDRFDDIAKFADIGDFLDQPVKTYSSGMQVRLAFSVAINVEPEILIVDEALSVGDELFQRKCFSRIEAIRNNGATILFVSHAGGTIVELCDRALLMDAGELLAIGQPKQIVGRYQKLLYAPEDAREALRAEIRKSGHDQKSNSNTAIAVSASIEKSEPTPEFQIGLQESFDPNLRPSSTIEYESHGAYIENPQILTLDGTAVNHLARGKTYCYTYKARFTKSASNVRFGMMIKTISGIELGGAASANSPRNSLAYVEAGSIYRIEFRFNCALNIGTYFMNAGITGDIVGIETFLHRVIDVAMFRILPDSKNLATGIIDFSCCPEIEKL